jgi:uncharacterized RDD family membrane protein YckC
VEPDELGELVGGYRTGVPSDPAHQFVETAPSGSVLGDEAVDVRGRTSQAAVTSARRRTTTVAGESRSAHVHDPVITPEAVALDLEPATVGSRSVAIVLDYLLIGAGLLLLGAAEAAFGFSGFVPDWLGIALLLLLAFALQFGYPIGFETLMRGRTPGKAAMGLRVITLEGAPVRFRHASARAAVGLLELLGTLGAIAVIASFASPRGQRLGDLAAGTLVVRERRSGGAPQAMRFEPPPGLESYVRILDVSRIGASDYATIRDLLRRRLDHTTRESVARRVAEGIVDRVQPPPPEGADAVTWLQCVAAAVQARSGSGPSERRLPPAPRPAEPTAPRAVPPPTDEAPPPPPPTQGFRPPQ